MKKQLSSEEILEILKKSACDTCRAPGSCCKYIWLYYGDKKDFTDTAEDLVAKHNLPFVPVKSGVKINPRAIGPFVCKNLINGRCSDYENRPYLCRVYDAKSDNLCAEYQPTLRGIPVILERA